MSPPQGLAKFAEWGGGKKTRAARAISNFLPTPGKNPLEHQLGFFRYPPAQVRGEGGGVKNKITSKHCSFSTLRL